MFFFFFRSRKCILNASASKIKICCNFVIPRNFLFPECIGHVFFYWKKKRKRDVYVCTSYVAAGARSSNWTGWGIKLCVAPCWRYLFTTTQTDPIWILFSHFSSIDNKNSLFFRYVLLHMSARYKVSWNRSHKMSPKNTCKHLELDLNLWAWQKLKSICVMFLCHFHFVFYDKISNYFHSTSNFKSIFSPLAFFSK